MLVAAAIACGILALIAAVLGFMGVLKGMAGAAKALFFGFVAVAGVLAAIAFFMKDKAG